MMDRRKIIFIINPISGVGKQRLVEKVVDDVLDLNKYDYQIAYTQYKGHAKEIAKQAVQDKIDMVVVVGGDGSVNEVSEVLFLTETVMGIIPTGSGNGLARCLHIPLEVRKAINVLNYGEVQEIDTVFANDKMFVSIAGLGFDALVAKKFRKTKRRGLIAYLRIIFWEFARYRPEQYVLEMDHETVGVKALMVSIANGNQFGYDFPIAPNAKVNDGFFDVCVIKKPPVFKTILVGLKFYLQTLDKSPRDAQFYTTKELVIKQKKARHMNIDGEAILMPQRIRVKNHTKSLKVMVPSSSIKEMQHE